MTLPGWPDRIWCDDSYPMGQAPYRPEPSASEADAELARARVAAERAWAASSVSIRPNTPRSVSTLWGRRGSVQMMVVSSDRDSVRGDLWLYRYHPEYEPQPDDGVEPGEE